MVDNLGWLKLLGSIGVGIAVVVWHFWRRRLFATALKEVTVDLQGIAKEGFTNVWISGTHEGRAVRLRFPLPGLSGSYGGVVFEFTLARDIRGRVRPRHASDDLRRLGVSDQILGRPTIIPVVDWFEKSSHGTLVLKKGKARVARVGYLDHGRLSATACNPCVACSVCFRAPPSGETMALRALSPGVRLNAAKVPPVPPTGAGCG